MQGTLTRRGDSKPFFRFRIPDSEPERQESLHNYGPGTIVWSNQWDRWMVCSCETNYDSLTGVWKLDFIVVPAPEPKAVNPNPKFKPPPKTVWERLLED